MRRDGARSALPLYMKVAGHMIAGLSAVYILSRAVSFLSDSFVAVDSALFQAILTGGGAAVIAIAAGILAWRTYKAASEHTAGARAVTSGFALAIVLAGMMPATSYLETAIAYTKIASTEKDEAPSLVIDGRDVTLKGTIGYGTSRRVAEAIRKHPEINRLVLESGGGRLAPAIALAEIVKAHELAVHVPNLCASACTLPLVASPDRSAGEKAHIGFHAFSLADAEDRENEHVARLFERHWTELADTRIDREFLVSAWSRPASSIWYPARSTLNDAGVFSPASPAVAISGK